MGVEDKSRMVAQLAAKQGTRLHRFLRRHVRNAADIPDLMQEVFLRLLRVPHHETIRTPEAYLMTIARHVAQQHRLQAAPEKFVDLDEVLEELRSCSYADPVLEATAEQCREELEETFRHMTPKVQATFLLHRRDGLTMDQVSERLGSRSRWRRSTWLRRSVQSGSGLKEGG